MQSIRPHKGAIISYLILDVDKSLSSIGGYTAATTLSGLPPVPINSGFSQLNRVMKKLVSRGERAIDHPIFGKSMEPFVELTALAKQNNLQGVVTDTFTVASQQEIQLITAPQMVDGEPRQMELKDWGVLGQRGTSYLMLNSLLPIWSVTLGHMNYEKDGATGIMFWQPALAGGTKDQMPKFFDVILVCRTVHTKGKESVFTWLTRPDNQFPAKDRLGVLPAEMPQDFKLVFEAYAKAGVLNPKILVLGKSGSGKTYSLRTIPPEFAQSIKAPTASVTGNSVPTSKG
jgi:hypothetical protein